MNTPNKSVMFSCGNFNVTATLNDEAQAGADEKFYPFLLAGITQTLQRQPATKAEKEFAAELKLWKDDKGVVTDKRPKGFDRTLIPYTPERASKLAVVMGEAVADVADVEVTEYTPGEGSEPKYAAEKKIINGKGGDAAKLRALAEKVGYEGDGKLDGENIEFVLKVREFIRAI